MVHLRMEQLTPSQIVTQPGGMTHILNLKKVHVSIFLEAVLSMIISILSLL